MSGQAPPSRPVRPPFRPGALSRTPGPSSSSSLSPAGVVRPVRPPITALGGGGGGGGSVVRPAFPVRPPSTSTSGPIPPIRPSSSNTGFSLAVTSGPGVMAGAGGVVRPVGTGLGMGGSGVVGSRPSFRPVAPVRRIKTEDLPPPPPSTSRGRPPRPPRGRGRGRGGPPGVGGRGGNAMADEGGAVASGPFALGPSNIARTRATPIMAPLAQPGGGSAGANNAFFTPTGDLYSDEEYGGKDIIDMELVPSLSGESAPTALLRDRSVQEAVKRREREKERDRERKIKDKKKDGVKKEVTDAARTVLAGPQAIVVKDEDGARPSVPGTTSANPTFKVKDEPISPEIVAQQDSILAGLANGTGAPQARDDDTLQDIDMDRDVDAMGRNLALPISVTNSVDGDSSRDGTPVSGTLAAQVKEAAKKAVDLSESESEDEEEDMTGDFVHEPGKENPNDKIYLFQFPVPFPSFVPHPAYSHLRDIPPVKLPDIRPDPVAAPEKEQNKMTRDVKPILKKNVAFFEDDEDMEKAEAERAKAAAIAEAEATAAAEKAEKDRIAFEHRRKEAYERAKAEHAERYKKMEKERKPEGRIGTLVVMKSGRVKVVLGDGIVMDATPGVPTTFVQQLVHLDQTTKTASVLGEINKSYVITPDIDRLLEELRGLDGVVPGENDVDVKPKVGGPRGKADVKPVIKRE